MHKFGEINNTSEIIKTDAGEVKSTFDTDITCDEAKSFWDKVFNEPREVSISDILNYDEDEFEFDIDITDMSELLGKFDKDNWDEQTDAEKNELVEELTEKISEKLRLHEIPEVVYFEDDPSLQGVYYEGFNMLGINNCLRDNPKELVNTIAHELRHAYQKQCADSPQNYEEMLYKVNWQNYISPVFNENGELLLYTDYFSQYIEAEARAFANIFGSERQAVV